MNKIRKKIKQGIRKGNYPTCYLCGKKITKEDDFSFDHVLPKSCGGETKPENLFPAHKICNNNRGTMPLSMWFCGIRKQRTRS
jgi:5-methylcytosine-specific restriction endonuclease McrA